MSRGDPFVANFSFAGGASLRVHDVPQER